MIKKKISIIGTSRITSHHITAAIKVGFEIYSISSTRKNSKFINQLSSKHNIKNVFYSWKDCIDKSINFDKDISFVITAPTIKNKIILKYLSNFNSKVFIEKPVFNNFFDFENINSNKKNIFVGYNRIFYRNINYLKKKLYGKKNLNVICNVPEISKKMISSNSCHIFSILIYLFGHLNFINKFKNKNYINILLKSKFAMITLFFNFKASENFSIKIYDKKTIYELLPIETLNIYKEMKIVNIKNQNFYRPLKANTIIETNNIFKPGFVSQYKEFSRFIDGKKIFNNIDFAKYIQKLIYKF